MGIINVLDVCNVFDVYDENPTPEMKNSLETKHDQLNNKSLLN